MSSFFDVTASSLFSANLMRQSQAQGMAMRALNSGLQAFVDKKYDTAIDNLRRAAALYPQSDIAKNAFEYMARSHAALGDTDKALKAYGESLGMDPNQANIRLDMGNLLFANERYDEAVLEYEKAAKLDPSPANLYSLGQGYLKVERFDDAERAFAQVKQLTPREPEADVALGQALAKQGKSDEAIRSFQNAIDLQRDFWNAYSELGLTLADDGRLDEAREIQATLADQDASLAAYLEQYIDERAGPRITRSTVSDLFTPFTAGKGPGTALTDLDPSLSTPGSVGTFALNFSFDKPMDRASIQNIDNWNIGRATGSNRIDRYNFGNPIPATDIALPDKPAYVLYDATYRIATVVFKLTQNEAGNATLDPSHIRFTFKGQDEAGRAIDPLADEYTGFTGIA